MLVSDMLIEKTPKRENLFWKKVHKGEKCWEWTGCLSTEGYGRFGTVKVTHYAHRVSYEWYKGPITNKVVRHKCDNPKCVKPDHLEIGTYKDNSCDMVERGRHIGGRKIKPIDVVAIRWDRFYGKSVDLLCSEYGLSPQQISSIARGKFWPKLGGPLTSRKKKGFPFFLNAS